MLKALLFLGVFVLVSCSQDLTEIQKEEIKSGIKVIYGDDDRLDIYEVEDQALLALADSTVALVQSSKVSIRSDGTADLSLSSYKSNYNLCSNEPFVNQKTAAFCSGALVGKDLVITAGHCITSESSCKSTKLVFGFAIKDGAGSTPSKVNASEVYSCKQIVRRVQSGGTDYAVIKIDREVENHKPLKVYRGEVLSAGTGLTVIGHPSGLATKVASGGKIRSSNDIYYVTDLDTYGGNSGSAVFNSETKEIMGILVRGENDFVKNGNCNVSNRCAEGKCRGEDVTRINLVTDIIPELDESPEEPEEPVVLTETFSSSSVVSIPDKNLTGITSVIAVDKTPDARKVQVEVNIEHTYVGDLQITLIDPSGKSFLLRKNSGGRQKNLVGVFGKDLSSLSSLGELSNISVKGNWSLKVVDSLSRDVGSLKGWKVIFTP